MNTQISHQMLESAIATEANEPSKAQIRLRMAIFLIVADAVAVCAGFLLARLLRFGTFAPNGIQLLLGMFLPIYFVCAGFVRAFSGQVALRRSVAVGRAFMALFLAAGMLGLVLFSLRAGTMVSRLHLGLGLLISGVLLAAMRTGYVSVARRSLGGSLFSVVEINDGTRPSGRGRSIDTSAFFDPFNPDPISLDQLARLIGKADRVVVNCRQQARSAWAHVLQGMNTHAEIEVGELGDVQPLGLGSHDGAATFIVARGPLGLRERAFKRLFDLAFAVASLIALSPLFLLVTIAIKLESPGPVFFTQPRIGRQNRLFHVYKFRSMRHDGADMLGTRSTARNDSRITRVGQFIRRTSIDELPQLLNVLLGDMSVVGPRPHAVHSTAEGKLFWDIDRRYWHRHACRPGITGLAQIRGYRGATEKTSDLANRVEADLNYLQDWSFAGDLKIILQTIRVLIHPNAY